VANPEHLKVLNEGAEFWNSWRVQNPYVEPDLEQAWIKGKNFKGYNLSSTNLHGAELSGAYLMETNLSRANLGEAELRGCILTRANLAAADLRLATLVRADLRGADLSRCRLDFARICEADLTDSVFDGADLSWSDLRLSVAIDASFRRSKLRNVNLGCASFKRAFFEEVVLVGACVEETDFSGATFQGGEILSTDLSQVGSFDGTTHIGPTEIGLNTLTATAAGLATNPMIQLPLERFFRGCGIEEHSIDYFRALVDSPVKPLSVFITYDGPDEAFAQSLHDHLQQRGIRCWLDHVGARRGRPAFLGVDRGHKHRDRTLLCCSKSSLKSSWISSELNKHFSKSNQSSEHSADSVLVPLDLDGYLYQKNEAGRYLWQHSHSDRVRSHANGSFQGWDEDSFDLSQKFERFADSLVDREFEG
jgi:uncharacterized protein YjbI with pentapeptide repeats